MKRLLLQAKLPALILLAAWLGYILLAAPSITTVRLADGVSTVAVPQSLEGWKLETSEGDKLVTGTTRLGVITLEIERTHISVNDPALGEYISQRHSEGWKQWDDYQIRLKGEFRSFGRIWAPVARSVYDGPFLGSTVNIVQHDTYLVYKGEYVRVGMCFPEFLDQYTWVDQTFIANNLKLAQ